MLVCERDVVGDYMVRQMLCKRLDGEMTGSESPAAGLTSLIVHDAKTTLSFRGETTRSVNNALRNNSIVVVRTNMLRRESSARSIDLALSCVDM